MKSQDPNYDTLIHNVIDFTKEYIYPRIQNDYLSCANGPYKHKESPLRSLCHFGVIYAYGTIYIDKKYKVYADVIIKELLSNLSDATIKFRLQDGVDHGNGVIGCAWILECLYYYQKNLDYNFDDIVIELFNSFEFDYQNSRFKRQHEDRKYGIYDNTFNHNLWLIYGFSLYDHIQPIKKLVDNYKKNHLKLVYYPDGIIYHKCLDGKPTSLRSKIRFLKWYPKSVSYQYFNIHALRRLMRNDHDNKMSLVINFKPNILHVLIMIFQKHGLRYNPSGWNIRNETSIYEKILILVNNLLLKVSLRIKNKYFNWDHKRLISRIYEKVPFFDDN
tara:strand:- start:1191 stop:2183 length:993 start_codon:yes stop_codon:yes gene_type:complete